MNFLSSLYKKFGGTEYLLQLCRARILLFSFFIILFLGFKRKSLEIARQAINNRRLQKIRKWNRKFIANYLQQEEQDKEQKQSNKVWVLWLQGMESAPLIVKKCYESLKTNLLQREIILLTEENYRNYAKFPQFIQDKIDRGIITRTHFSDLLRLELLEKYGGTWIDATVYCSGSNYPDYLFDSNLFVFQCLKPGLDGEPLRISSWFMSAASNNPIIRLTKALLYNYWEKHNTLIDYFLIHDFFELSIETYPSEWDKVIPFCNSTPHILLLRLFETYDEHVWDAIKKQSCFHKLSYKFNKDVEKEPETYFAKIFNNGTNED